MAFWFPPLEGELDTLSITILGELAVLPSFWTTVGELLALSVLLSKDFLSGEL